MTLPGTWLRRQILVPVRRLEPADQRVRGECARPKRFSARRPAGHPVQRLRSADDPDFTGIPPDPNEWIAQPWPFRSLPGAEVSEFAYDGPGRLTYRTQPPVASEHYETFFYDGVRIIQQVKLGTVKLG